MRTSVYISPIQEYVPYET